MEVYNIRDIKLLITKVLYTPAGCKFRIGSKFAETSIQDSRFIFLIYSGKQRFIEIGFDSIGVYKGLRFLFREKSINNIILNLKDLIDGLNRK